MRTIEIREYFGELIFTTKAARASDIERCIEAFKVLTSTHIVFTIDSFDLMTIKSLN